MNEQEEFWANEFGTEYIKRNKSEQMLQANKILFRKILDYTDGISSILELGSNVGMNLEAISSLAPDAVLDAVEINKTAVAILKDKNICREIFNQSISTFSSENEYDLVFTKTVLIHLNETDLNEAYKCLYEYSNRYILIAEYYNPVPVTIKYRGHDNKLFKRDFCSDLMQLFPDLKLVKYGFVYKKDPVYQGGQDDVTWFLLEK